MARYRSRSYSPRRRSRSPRTRGRKRYDDEPRRSYGDRRSPAPSGLLVRNLPLDARTEDLRVPFERYGPVKDVYLPKNYYTGEPRGFGFVKFRYGEDAAEAKQLLNHSLIGGREIKIVFAEENRKTPQEMRLTSRVSGRYGGGRRRSSPTSPRRRYHSYSRSPSPRRDSRSHRARDDNRSLRRSRSISQSVSPRDERDYRSKERSPSPMENGRRNSQGERDYRSKERSPSPVENGCRNSQDERDYRSKERSPSPVENGRRNPQDERDYKPSRSRSPRGNSRSPSRSRSRSYGPR